MCTISDGRLRLFPTKTKEEAVSAKGFRETSSMRFTNLRSAVEVEELLDRLENIRLRNAKLKEACSQDPKVSVSTGTIDEIRLPSFCGRVDEDIDAFLMAMSHYLELKQVPAQSRVRILHAALRGDALLWFMNIANENDEYKTYEELEGRLRQKFQFYSNEYELMDKLLSIRQGQMTTREYVSRYESLLGKFCSHEKLSEWDKKYYFIRGLNPLTQNWVLRKEPKTFHEARRYALSYLVLDPDRNPFRRCH